MILLLALVSLLPSCKPNAGETRVCLGEVLEIIDGNTIRVKCDNDSIVIILAELDAPETNNKNIPCNAQPYSREAANFLEKQLKGQKIELRFLKESFEHPHAHIYLHQHKTRWINLELVQLGLTYADRQHAGHHEIIDGERQAKINKRGIWGLNSQCVLRPWKWRKIQHKCRLQKKWRENGCFNLHDHF